jgi:hypothetical protein
MLKNSWGYFCLRCRDLLAGFVRMIYSFCEAIVTFTGNSRAACIIIMELCITYYIVHSFFFELLFSLVATLGLYHPFDEFYIREIFFDSIAPLSSFLSR